jgi:succinyl-diaminopimelate desuccinylase
MVNYNSVISNIEKEELVKFTQNLIRINSVFDPEIEGQNESKVAEFIFKFLRDQGFDVIIEKVVENRPNIIATLKGKQTGKSILFEGHMDVVTAGNLDEWTKDPFGGEIYDGRIYGRGSCDTKGNMAAAIYAVKAIKDSKIEFNGKIVLCIPCDEEGMMIGIKDFIKKGHAKNIDGAIICEPEENQICIFQKGAMRIGITVFGKQSHGCMPLAGINPNTRLAKIIIELEKFEKREKRRLGKHKYLGFPSVTPTIIISPKKGERQINVVPSEAYMTLDIRTVPGQKHFEILQAIEDIFVKLAKKDKDFKAKLELIEERPWTETDKEDPIVEAVKFAYRKVTSKKPKINGVPGATDGTFLNTLAGIPVVVTGAGGRTIPHQGDEYVDIEELFTTSKIYATCALNFLAGEKIGNNR